MASERVTCSFSTGMASSAPSHTKVEPRIRFWERVASTRPSSVARPARGEGAAPSGPWWSARCRARGSGPPRVVAARTSAARLSDAASGTCPTSSISTAWPRSTSALAAATPEGPEPTTAIRNYRAPKYSRITRTFSSTSRSE